MMKQLARVPWLWLTVASLGALLLALWACNPDSTACDAPLVDCGGGTAGALCNTNDDCSDPDEICRREPGATGGQTRCQMPLCIDTTSNRGHCGGCFVMCAEGEACVDSVCVPPEPRTDAGPVGTDAGPVGTDAGSPPDPVVSADCAGGLPVVIEMPNVRDTGAEMCIDVGMTTCVIHSDAPFACSGGLGLLFMVGTEIHYSILMTGAPWMITSFSHGEISGGDRLTGLPEGTPITIELTDGTNTITFTYETNDNLLTLLSISGAGFGG